MLIADVLQSCPPMSHMISKGMEGDMVRLSSPEAQLSGKAVVTPQCLQAEVGANHLSAV